MAKYEKNFLATEYELNFLAILALFALLGIVVSSIAIWVQKERRNPLQLGQCTMTLPPLNIKWVDFLIFIFTGFFLVFLAQFVLSPLKPELPVGQEAELNLKIALFSILSLHGPILLNYIIFQEIYLEQNSLRLKIFPSNLWEDLKQSLTLLVQFLPLIWLISILWSNLLKLLQNYSLIEEFPAQPLVEFMATDIPLLDFLIIAIIGIAFVPIVEEIIFRGCLYRFLKTRFTIDFSNQIGVFIAQLISAVIFALLHDNLNAFLPLVFVGFILARIYELTGSIHRAIFFHAFFNATSFIFLLLVKYSGLPLEIIFP